MFPTSIPTEGYREEALKHYLREEGGRGLLRTSPPWTWALVWTSGALVLGSLLFACFAKVEVNDRGKGILRPVGGVRLVYAPGAGIVSLAGPRSGDLVRKDQPLLSIDSPQLQGNLLEADHQMRLLKADFPVLSGQQDRLHEQQLQDHRKRIAAQEEDVRSFERSIGIQERRLNGTRSLHKQGIVGNVELEQAEEAVEQARRQHRTSLLALQQARQDLAGLLTQRQQQLYTRKSEFDTAKARREALGLGLSQLQISATSDGYLDGLVVKPGDLVQPGQVLAKLVPAGAPLQVVSFLPEKNRGFVQEGDQVHIELNQFPYAEFGTLRGRVVRLGKDLATSTEWREAMGEEAKEDGPSVKVEIELLPDRPGPLAKVPMRPGMLMNVRYTLRKQTLITFVLDPLKRWLH